MMNSGRWQETKTDEFWGGIAPCDHLVQIYESESAFLEILSGYVADGIEKGESVIIIATSEHTSDLERKLRLDGHDVFELKLTDQLILLDAQDVLTQFMIDGWPDEILFRHAVKEILTRAFKRKTRVRAFGEMVAILWAQGNADATVQLERLWNKLQDERDFALYCAYPRSGFTQDVTGSVMNICGLHSKIIATDEKPSNVILYKDMSLTKKPGV